MRESKRLSWRHASALMGWALIYYFAGVVSQQFDSPDFQISLVWFPSGVAVAAFLAVRWGLWPLLFFIFSIVSVLLEQHWREDVLSALFYSVLSLPASVIIAWIVRRFARPNDDLHAILLWISATLIISALDALITGGGIALAAGLPLFSLFWVSLIADVTGILFVTIIIMGFLNIRVRSARLTLRAKLSGAVVWLLLCASTWLIFSGKLQDFAASGAALYFALSCLPIAIAIVLSIVAGNRGGSLALLTLGAIVIFYTYQHKGPFFLQGLHRGEPLLLTQCYLTATALLMVFLRGLSHSIHSFNPETGRIEGDGVMYQLNPESGEILWDSDIGTLLGERESTAFQHIDDVLPRIHPQDREKLKQHWRAAEGREPQGALVLRIRTANGEWLSIVDGGCVLLTSAEGNRVMGNWQISQYN
ncbi:MASE1 domain-containing protein [Yersinia nurmii]|uniref:MASE1 domain-containing protein n=1 Tax=Yersinia nurmii TaxID=685706 RepID=A0AAW7K8Q9_9GAMM|nr:MASE1 domain-containing protein [Yersinia nurmii]MDN0087435.1 MASE1 domain-containing protein [Yersinia nurmii]